MNAHKEMPTGVRGYRFSENPVTGELEIPEFLSGGGSGVKEQVKKFYEEKDTLAVLRGKYEKSRELMGNQENITQVVIKGADWGMQNKVVADLRKELPLPIQIIDRLPNVKK